MSYTDRMARALQHARDRNLTGLLIAPGPTWST
ncbi:hypothetical protein HNR30_008820 [Nonomuraea soli]|uniref:Uncharacterized protein n=1 Tax=Nonomuraea soli TaxID=1032476 RepID=A0A7W0CU61_9ACTN|nr:hypothetical protein [Nonomuraea soli]